MTKKEAYETIRSTFDDDNLSESEQQELFEAIYGRKPDENESGIIWSLLCSGTSGLCGCSTRRDHEQGECGTKISIWDVGCGVEMALNADGELVGDDAKGYGDIIMPFRNFTSPARTARAILNKWVIGYDGDPAEQELRVEVTRDGRTAIARA